MATPRQPGMYILTDYVTGLFYVGSTHDLNTRISNHWATMDSGKHDNLNIRKLVSSIECSWMVSVVKTDTLEEARALEQEQLDLHRGNVEMLNISTSAYGGSGPMPIERVRAQTGRGNLMYGRKGPAHHLYGLKGKDSPMYGLRRTPEQCAARAGKNHPQWGTKHTKEYNDNQSAIHGTAVSIEGETYTSYTRAARALNVDKATVGNRCRSTRPEWISWFKL